MLNIPVSRPFIGEEEADAARDAVIKGDISGIFGSYIQEFEKGYASFCGTKHAITVNSGTTALHLAIATLEIGPGDDVLVSSLTNMATFFAVLYQGARPIPIDIKPDTYNIDPALLEEKLTPKTKAIIIVHLYGHPVDMGPVMEFSHKYRLRVIEDVAEAHGAEWNGQRVGSFGDISCHSFYANKILTTGEGGMLTLNDDRLANRAKTLKTLAFGKENKFIHQDIGYNYRLTNIQCAIGVIQLKKINEILRLKRSMAAFYTQELNDIEGLQLPVEKSYAKNVYWMYHVVLTGSLEGKRTAIMSKLKERGIETRESFVPFNQQIDIIKKYHLDQPHDCPIANRISREGFYLPSGTVISQLELETVVHEVRSICRKISCI
ncbi:DegT/DnrJ/EryC1/StrS aminotransferase family protein [Candidatus Uhrbacteria bacterium]|nr:DegT/DnrJ/EryC1/StrS aminotransferase family protein [Candidatus Uhrbacteria bacterium]